MKISASLSLLFTVLLSAQLFAQNTGSPKSTPKVELYYFHPTERCPIDQAIEENTRATMQSYFVNEVKSGKILFRVLNTEEKANEKIIARFDINAQALYLVKNENGKSIQTDLTSFAFDYGKSNPQKFKLKLKEEIEAALK